MNIWLTADLHCGHNNILKYCNRPFADIYEHDQTLISNINKVVKSEDQLWIVGDFTMKDAATYRRSIKCKDVRLVLGNHDRPKPMPSIFQEVCELKTLKHNQYRGLNQTVLSHYPMLRWPKSHFGNPHFYGHTHRNLRYGEGRSLNVGVDQWDYKPVNLHAAIDEILDNEIKTLGKPREFLTRRV